MVVVAAAAAAMATCTKMLKLDSPFEWQLEIMTCNVRGRVRVILDAVVVVVAATDAEAAVAAAAAGSDAGPPSPFGLSSEDGEDDVVFVKATGKGKATSSDDDDGVVTKANGKGKATSRFALLSDTDNSLSDSDHQTSAITDAFVVSLTPVRLRAQEVLPNLKRHFAKKVKKYGSDIATVLVLNCSNKAQKKRAKQTDNAKKAKQRKIDHRSHRGQVVHDFCAQV